MSSPASTIADQVAHDAVEPVALASDLEKTLTTLPKTAKAVLHAIDSKCDASKPATDAECNFSTRTIHVLSILVALCVPLYLAALLLGERTALKNFEHNAIRGHEDGDEDYTANTNIPLGFSAVLGAATLFILYSIHYERFSRTGLSCIHTLTSVCLSGILVFTLVTVFIVDLFTERRKRGTIYGTCVWCALAWLRLCWRCVLGFVSTCVGQGDLLERGRAEIVGWRDAE